MWQLNTIGFSQIISYGTAVVTRHIYFCSERFALFNIFHKVHLVRERLGTFAYWSYIKMVLRRTRYLKINFLANRQPNFSLKANSLHLKLNEGWKKPIYTKIQYKSFIVFHLMLLNTSASPFCTTRKYSSHSTHKFDPFRDSINMTGRRGLLL